MRVIPFIFIAALSRGPAALDGESPAPAGSTHAVDYNRDVRPILADRCCPCHGPDAARRKAELRLDIEEGALAERKGSRAIVPGDPAQSLLVTRVRHEDARKRMPPPSSGKTLSATE